MHFSLIQFFYLQLVRYWPYGQYVEEQDLLVNIPSYVILTGNGQRDATCNDLRIDNFRAHNLSTMQLRPHRSIRTTEDCFSQDASSCMVWLVQNSRLPALQAGYILTQKFETGHLVH